MAHPQVRFRRLAVPLAIAGLLVGSLATRDPGVARAATSPGTGGYSCPGSIGGRSLDGPTSVGTPGVIVQGNASNDFLVTCSYPGPSVEWAIEVAWTPAGSSSHTFQGCGSIPINPESTWVSRDYWAYVVTNLDDPPEALRSAALQGLKDVLPLASPCESTTPSPSVVPPDAGSGSSAATPPSAGSPSSADSPGSAGSAASTGQPLCEEAIEKFGDSLGKAGVPDPKVTRLRTNRTEILTGFMSVITAYNTAHPYRPARSPVSSASATMGAIDWLWEPGGLSSKILDKVGAVSSAPAKGYVTGTERQLASRITSATHPLSPAEVFALALDLSHGNVTNALLTAHNTLRALGRVDVVNQTLTGVLPDRTVFGKQLADLRSGAENSGPWYHLFGTAYFELMSTETGKGAEAAQALAFGADGTPAGASALGTRRWASTFAGWLPPTSTLSGFANWMEQLVRASAGSKRDAEKYCVNVWGAQIGALLAQMMGGTANYRNTFADNMSDSEINVLQSPFSMRWTSPQGTTTIDQKSGAVRFGTPLLVYPLNEGSTWGAVIVPPEHTSGTVTFVATVAGADLHFLRVNTAAGLAVLYRATASSAGEEMTLPLGDAAFGKAMTTSGGKSIEAQRLTLTTTGPSSPSAGLTDEATDRSGDTATSRSDENAPSGSGGAAGVVPKLIAALAGAMALSVGGAALLTRRRRRGIPGS